MRVRRAVFDAIAAHARHESPRECCGLLLGSGHEVVEAVPTDNVAADPLRRYQVSPVEHFAQIRRCRESMTRGAPTLDVVGAYHSHPRSAPTPSPTDSDEASPDFLYVIAGPADDSAQIEIRAYRLETGKLEEVQLDATPDEEAV